MPVTTVLLARVAVVVATLATTSSAEGRAVDHLGLSARGAARRLDQEVATTTTHGSASALEAAAYVWAPFASQLLAAAADVSVDSVISGSMEAGDAVTRQQVEELVEAASTYFGADAGDVGASLAILVDAWVVQAAPAPVYFWREPWRVGDVVRDWEWAAESTRPVSGDRVSARDQERLAEAEGMDVYVDNFVLVESFTTSRGKTFGVTLDLLYGGLDVGTDFGQLERGVARVVAPEVDEDRVVATLLQSQRRRRRGLASGEDPGSVVRFAIAAATSQDAEDMAISAAALTPADYEAGAVAAMGSSDVTVLAIASQATVSASALAGSSAAPSARSDDDSYAQPEYAASKNVEAMSGVYHHGENDFDAEDSGYRASILVVGFVIFVSGLLAALILCCFCSLARCRCCRRRHKCCFPKSHAEASKQHQGLSATKLGVAFLLLSSGVAVLTGASVPRRDFVDAAEGAAALLRRVGDVIGLADESMRTIRDAHLPAYVASAESMTCDKELLGTTRAGSMISATVRTFCVETQVQLNSALASTDGLDSDLSDLADFVEDDVARLVNVASQGLACVYWVVIAVSILSLCTKCRSDDCLAQCLALLIVALSAILLAALCAVSVGLSDFCVAPASSHASLAEDLAGVDGDALEFFNFVSTCATAAEVTNPVRNETAPVWRGLTTLQLSLELAKPVCSVQPLINATEETRAVLGRVDRAIGCASLNSIYHEAVYETACGDFLDGLTGMLKFVGLATFLLWLGVLLTPCVNYDGAAKVFTEPVSPTRTTEPVSPPQTPTTGRVSSGDKTANMTPVALP